ncbi:MAG: hypothetical protein OEW12_06030, partial [Deltaproteobacteria bacterium]|nr:hypothetical protein [Deltaproteobacteria bacterium]
MASNPRDTDALKKASPPADRGESPPEDIEDFNEFFEQLSDMDDVELSTPPDAALGGLRLAEEDQLESKWNQALLGKPAPFRQTLASPPSKMGQFHSQEPTSESKPAKPPLPVMKPGFGLFTGLKVIFLGGLMFLAGLGAVALVLLPPGAAPPWKSDHSGAVGGGVAE